jgi:hypothetical protein
VAGVILGTAAYMSPEAGARQAGRQAGRLLSRCLRKDPRQRLPDSGAARLELQDVLSGVVVDTQAPGRELEPALSVSPDGRQLVFTTPERASRVSSGSARSIRPSCGLCPARPTRSGRTSGPRTARRSPSSTERRASASTSPACLPTAAGWPSSPRTPDAPRCEAERAGLHAAGILLSYEKLSPALALSSPALLMRNTTDDPEWRSWIYHDHASWFAGSGYVAEKLFRDYLDQANSLAEPDKLRRVEATKPYRRDMAFDLPRTPSP